MSPQERLDRRSSPNPAPGSRPHPGRSGALQGGDLINQLRRAGRLHFELGETFENMAESLALGLDGIANPWMHGDVASPKSELQSLLSVKDVAKLLKVNERTVRRWRKEGRLPAGKEIAGVIRWNPDEIQDWLRNGGGG